MVPIKQRKGARRVEQNSYYSAMLGFYYNYGDNDDDDDDAVVDFEGLFGRTRRVAGIR